ncbi:MAG: hypothetical protein AAF915_02330 [Cyanobacteria bacterium P01_D01_bin.50]
MVSHCVGRVPRLVASGATRRGRWGDGKPLRWAGSPTCSKWRNPKGEMGRWWKIQHSLVTTHHSPLTTHHSPLTTHHSPLTTHHSLLTTHHS